MKLKIHTQILIAMIAGVICGAIFKEQIVFLKHIGDLFISLLKMIIVPLIFASIVSGVMSIGSMSRLGRVGAKTFLYYLSTTVLAIGVGLVLVNLIQPGVGVELPTDAVATDAQPPSIWDIVNDIVPSNIVSAMANGNVLGVIFFALLFGAAISAIGEKAKSVAHFFSALNAIMMKITDWIMRLAPIGVFALMAYMVGQIGMEILKPVGLYMVTVLVGLAIHSVVTLSVLLRMWGKYSPFLFIRQVFSAVATAFSTASSAATLPITMECVEQEAKVPNHVASFVLPLGATMNMDGTALYEAVAAMFIAQAYGIELSFASQIVIVLTATLASIGAAAIPSAGLVTMVIVLRAVNLPLEGIAIIVGVDRILDMFRTAVNVWGDACGTVVVARFEGERNLETQNSKY